MIAGLIPLTRPIAQGCGIRERKNDLGGTFKVASSAGRGTVLTISLPWPPATAHG